jgi:hypothetical protein
MKRVAIVNFTGFRNNWGCQATSFELLKFIVGCYGTKENLKFTLIPLLSHCRMDLEYQERLDEIYAAFSDVVSGNAKQGTALAMLEEICLRRYGHYAEKVRAADLVVFQAEGAMGLGADFARGPRLMLLPFVAKHAWKKTVITLNQGFYSHDARVIKNAVEAFGSFDFTAFREGASVALARENGLHQAAYVPDLAFLTTASGNMNGTSMQASPGYFAISGSALKDPDRHRLILGQADQIRQATGLVPLIALSRDNKLKILTRLNWRPGSYTAVPATSTYTNVAAMLQRCEFLLGGRYHMAILAASVGTYPILLTGNSFKNEGLAALLGNSDPVRGFHDSDDIIGDVERFLANRDAVRARLAENISQIRQNISNAQNHIAEILAGHDPGPYRDTLPAYVSDGNPLDRYRKYGSGKPLKNFQLRLKRCVPAREKPAQLLEPIIEGHGGDRDAVELTLTKLAHSDTIYADYIRKAASRMAGWTVPNAMDTHSTERFTG